MSDTYTFPWGVYIGDLMSADKTTEPNSLPVLLPTDVGGFCIDYDTASENIANQSIENIVLLLADVLPAKLLHFHIFDFDIAPRFRYLSQLKSYGLYHLYTDEQSAKDAFENLEKMARYRLHDLLTPEMKNLSEYNQQAENKEDYHIVLINMNYYPDEAINVRRVKSFFDSASKAGFYTIFYNASDNHDDMEGNREKSFNYLRQRFHRVDMKDEIVRLSPELFGFAGLCKQCGFKIADADRSQIIAELIDALSTDKGAE